MNYYPFNLGDYAAHTAHLDLLEDLAYRRMLDLYYRTEQPLPYDWRQIARLIRMKDQGAEIEAVLQEFFVLTDDGWRHKRCDSEIERMQDKQAKAKASAAASVNARLARHANERSTNVERTLNERRPEVELPTPTPTPTPKEEKTKTPRSRALPCPDGVADQVWSDWQALRKAKRAPVTETVVDGARAEAIKAGMTLDAFLRVWCARGSQGLQADWLKPEERAAPVMPAWKTEQLARTAAFAGPAASKQAQEAAKTVAGACLFGHRPPPHHNEVSDAFTPLLG